jgi:predicted ATPase
MEVPLRDLIDEKFRSVDQRFIDQDKAISAALAAQEKAVSKAEIATEKRFESVNEFRAQLADQTRSFLPRLEYDRAHEALSSKFVMATTENAKQIAALSLRLESFDGRKGGQNASWGYLVGAIGVLGVIIDIILRVKLQ